MNPKKIKRVVVKLGTNTVIHNNHFNFPFVESMAKDISMQIRQGKQFILVSSGAIGLGLEKTHSHAKELSIEMQQAMAAIGQNQLMHNYELSFQKYNQIIAQVLLTQQNFENKQNLKNMKNTLEGLLSLHIVPIINENDAVAIEELAFKKHFSDNDMLAARVAAHLKADLLVIVSDVGGLFTENPQNSSKASLIERVRDISEVKPLASGKSLYGRGGFATKLEAAEIALNSGIPLIVTKGKNGFLEKILIGGIEGTLFER